MENKIAYSGKMPREFELQTEFCLSGFNETFHKRYDGFFGKNSDSSKQRNNHTRYKPETTKRMLQSYPSLNRRYCIEADQFINSFRKHKYYFHNNVFEDLMKTVWHPKNFDKFKYWDSDWTLD